MMAFNITHSFDGKCSTRPEQNLGGASRNLLSRDALLQKTQDKRRKRQEEKVQQKSAFLLLTHIRSYLVRKRIKTAQRAHFDNCVKSTQTNVEDMLLRLLYFYDFNTDATRMSLMCQMLIHNHQLVVQQLNQSPAFRWKIKRWLVLCLRNCSKMQTVDVMIKCLDLFANDMNNLEYLLGKGYFRDIRIAIELINNNNSVLDNTCTAKLPMHYQEAVNLVLRPFTQSPLILRQSEEVGDILFTTFIENILAPPLTNNMKLFVLPSLKGLEQFPYKALMDHLYKQSTRAGPVSNSLLYNVLYMQPENYTAVDERLFAVYAHLSRDLYRLELAQLGPEQRKRCMRAGSTDSSELSDDDDDSDDDNDVEMLDSENQQTSGDILKMSDFHELFNAPAWVRHHLTPFHEPNQCSTELLSHLISFCYNLMLAPRTDTIKSSLFLYRLGLNGNFIKALWRHLIANQQQLDIRGEVRLRPQILRTPETCAEHTVVLCNLFAFYTETLTNTDSCDTSGTFTRNDLFQMTVLLMELTTELLDSTYVWSRCVSIQMFRESPPVYCFFQSVTKCIKCLHQLDVRFHFMSPWMWSDPNLINVTQELVYTLLTSGTHLDRLSGHYLHSVKWLDRLPPSSRHDQRSLAVLDLMPFLTPFNSRVQLLRTLCQCTSVDSEMEILRQMHTDGGGSGGGDIVVIRRTHLYEDAFEKLRKKTDDEFRHRIRILFVNAAGAEEAGVDGGGIFKEFLNEFLTTAFDPNRGFFLQTVDDNTLYPNPNAGALVDNVYEHYYFIGRLVGKALFDGILVELPLAEFVLAKLLVDRASTHHLQSLDGLLYRNLLYLRDYEDDVIDLGLDFSIMCTDMWGRPTLKELKVNGCNIPVTNQTRLEYIQCLANWKLNGGEMQEQCTAFRRGITSIVPHDWLRMFSHQEVGVLISGEQTHTIDLSDLREHTVYSGQFNDGHATIQMFWRVVERFSGVQRKQLIKFVTSCSRPPLLGFKELHPPFCIQSSGVEERMPTASTCLNLLKMPIISEEAVLTEKLLSAIEQHAGFELS